MPLFRKSLFLISRDSVVKGSFLFTIGQFSLIISGYVVNVLLARILMPEGYGTYGLVMSILVWIEVILVSGIGKAVEKSVATQPERAKDIWRQTLWLQGAFAVILFCLTLILAPLISRLLNDTQLTFLIRFAALDLLFFGFFRLGRSLETGLQKFKRVAVILLVYALVKATAVPLLALSMKGLTGAIAGNTLASAAAVVVAFVFASRIPKSTLKGHFKEFKKNFLAVIPLSIFSISSMILVSLDLWVVKFLGLPERITGLYVAATMIPKALIIVSSGRLGIMISVVSSHNAARGYKTTRRSIFKIVSLFCFMLSGGALVVYIFAEPLIRIIFSEAYIEAVPYLRVLVFSYSFFAIAEMLSCTLVALDKVWNLSLAWVFMSIASVPTYVFFGRLWGPIGIASAVGVFSFVASVLFLWMIQISLTNMRRISDERKEPCRMFSRVD